MKWNRGAVLASSVCLGFLMSGPAIQAHGQTGNASMADKIFVKKAMEGSMAEIQLGQMAAEKGNHPDVKQFGQKMVDDHTRLNDQMKPVASEVGVNPPAELSIKDKTLQKKLGGLSGDAFDKAYMQAMVRDHRKDLAEFHKEASDGHSDAVKQAAQQGGEVIAQHLQLAKKVAGEVGAVPGGKPATASTEIK